VKEAGWKNPRALIVTVALLIPILSLIPNLYSRLSEPPAGQLFMGFRFMTWDHYQYSAFIRQAHDSTALLMENPFTSEIQRPSFFLPFFWSVGALSRISGLSIPAAWDVCRLLGGLLYIFFFWRITEFYLDDSKQRAWAALLFAAGGGLSWTILLLQATSLIQLESPDYPFYQFWNWSAFGSIHMPNWTWPALLLLVTGQLILQGARDPAGNPLRREGGRASSWQRLASVPLLPMIWFLHPYTGMVAYLTFGLLPVMPALTAVFARESLPWRRVYANFHTALPGLGSFLVVGCYLLWASTDEVFRNNSTNGFEWTYHYSAGWYLLCYGALLPLAWFGIRTVARQRHLAGDLMLAWLTAAVVASLNPFYAGVKFQYLVFPPLALLAAVGAFFLQGRISWTSSKRKLAVVSVTLVLFLNPPVILLWELTRSHSISRSNTFREESEVEALTWLNEQPDGLVLSGYHAGSCIPWRAGKKVYVGHWFMTLDCDQKEQEVAAFFSPRTPPRFKRQLLSRSGARYIYYGLEEATFGSIDPRLPLRKRYEKGGISIYEVTGSPTHPRSGL
jgi:hypothetical protein